MTQENKQRTEYLINRRRAMREAALSDLQRHERRTTRKNARKAQRKAE